MDIKMGIKGHQRHMQTLLGSRKVTPNLIPPHHEPFITMPAHEAYVDMFALLASHVNGLRQTMVQTLRRHCADTAEAVSHATVPTSSQKMSTWLMEFLNFDPHPPSSSPLKLFENSNIS